MKPTFCQVLLEMDIEKRRWVKIKTVILRSFPLKPISNLVILHIFSNCFWNFIESSKM